MTFLCRLGKNLHIFLVIINRTQVINDYTFEVGGKSKQQNQIEKDGKSFLVKDDIEYGYRNVIPLWAFGFNY